MNKVLKHTLLALAIPFAVTSVASAQTYSCPGGATPIVIPGVGTFCPASVDAPEINPAASMGGLAVLFSGALMVMGRKKKAISN